MESRDKSLNALRLLHDQTTTSKHSDISDTWCGRPFLLCLVSTFVRACLFLCQHKRAMYHHSKNVPTC